jgi:hypothetical protein
MSDVPVDGTLDEQLAYCRSHPIRLCAREGTFRLTADGFRQIEREDITRPESGIHFGDGWFPVECYRLAEPFRWMGNDAEVLVHVPPGGAVMELELEVGPGIERTPPVVQVFDPDGTLVADFRVEGRTTIGLVLSPMNGSARRSFWLRTLDGGRAVTNDQRILNFRVFRCDWARPKLAPGPRVPYSLALRQFRPTLARCWGHCARDFGRFSVGRAFAGGRLNCCGGGTMTSLKPATSFGSGPGGTSWNIPPLKSFVGLPASRSSL